MLKKLCVMCFVFIGLFTTVSVFAVPVNGWNWDNEDKTFLESIDTSKLSVWHKQIIKTQIALVGKNDSNITYEQLKAIIKNTDPVLEKADMLPTLCWIVKRFRGFRTNIVNDPTFAENKYVTIIISSQVLNGKEYRDRLFTNNYILKLSERDVYYLDRFLKFYNEKSFELPIETVKQDLKNIRRAYYKNIQLSDRWKKAVVDIELMIKSLD